jgi:hypothetical protein
LIYPILEEGQQEQKKAQNNYHQQQIHSQVILPSTITNSASQQPQVPNNISRRNNLGVQKMTPWKLSSLLSMQMNHHNTS